MRLDASPLTRRARLLATLQGLPVDRPPVSFYEINGLDEDPTDPDPFNIYSHPSWQPLIDLAHTRSDRIVMRSVPFAGAPPDPALTASHTESWQDGDNRFTRQILTSGHQTLTALTRRERDVNTTWQVEHLLKNPADLAAYLRLPAPEFGGLPDPSTVLSAEAALGDSGIVMIDTPDPLCLAAGLFSLADYTVLALNEPALFHRLLERFAVVLQPQVAAIAQALPGRLWRIYGPEYASPPYLPPRLFADYVVRYDTPLVAAIQRQGGYARLHCHGKISRLLPGITATGCTGLDPIEPPPQGDVNLEDVRRDYGSQMVLFGNLEASDLENLPTTLFAVKIRQALAEGTGVCGGSSGTGICDASNSPDPAARGFVLMPSSCPYGRVLTPLALANYTAMIELTEDFFNGRQVSSRQS